MCRSRLEGDPVILRLRLRTVALVVAIWAFGDATPAVQHDLAGRLAEAQPDIRSPLDEGERDPHVRRTCGQLRLRPKQHVGWRLRLLYDEHCANSRSKQFAQPQGLPFANAARVQVDSGARLANPNEQRTRP